MPYVVFYGTSGGIVGRNGEISGNNIIWRARGDGEDRGSPGVGPRHAPGFASTGWNIALICAGTMLLVPLSSRWQPRNHEGERVTRVALSFLPPPALRPPPSFDSKIT